MGKKDFENPQGILYIVGTPIGNLEDISLRALSTVKEVDLIVSEDTNRIKKLLSYYRIKKPTESYHAHSKESKKKFIISQLEKGKKIAYVSDAGMPCVCDPGSELVKCVRSEGIKVVAIPGPSAITSAISISGENISKFVFEGFLPRKKIKLIRTIEKFQFEERPVIFFESPHRLKKVMEVMFSILGGREIIIIREISKIFEEVRKGNLEFILKNCENMKGEITLILMPGGNK